MAFYLKKFSTHTEYEQYINGSGAILPNVSICKTEGDVHYNSSTPPTPQGATLTCVYVPTGGGSGSGSGSGSGGNSTKLFSSEFIESIESMKIDGVEQPSVVDTYDFKDTNAHTVTLNLKDDVTSIGNDAFRDCSGLTSCTIGGSVTSIGTYAFGYCSGLTSIDMPNSVTNIGDDAFGYCSGLTSVTIGSGVTSIGGYAFEYCSSLTSIDIPNSVTSIGRYAFYSGTSLTSIDIPSGVTSIDVCTFEGCSNLTSIDIPSGVTSIGESAFENCSSLTSIVSNPITPPTLLGESVFYGVGENGTLTVPSGSQGYCDWMSNLPSSWAIEGVTCGGSGSSSGSGA